ncbi:hypothetical protein N836_33030 [Leptolyngbya sp. Heron Island J]|nr:hypothetical protein N836_33030 [Leptolyngbya sp. Heron Island J]
MPASAFLLPGLGFLGDALTSELALLEEDAELDEFACSPCRLLDLGSKGKDSR